MIQRRSEYSLGDRLKGEQPGGGGLGQIHKVIMNDEELMEGNKVVCRVIKMNRVKSYVIEEIKKEAENLR
jgi:hypothetical protein